ncbi:Low-density lipoprotein receptor-related protein 4-like [Oopsacas minuta]|uniref:Low-density lipoprotein receptor-related protein 4-like n=1 Tax=Oopsacas minuta TaxID=111878 RepID=A0AAV7JAL0_9METZ|nr:Low-density lipoprotein receptor-related protein 4-like [Oopsacas minuta]
MFSESNYSTKCFPNDANNSTICEKNYGIFGILLQNESLNYISLHNNSVHILQRLSSNSLLCSSLDPRNTSLLVYAESTDNSAVIKEAVFDANTHEVSYTNVLYSYLLGEITGIAIESRTKLLYWIDGSREVIEIGTLEGDKRSVLVSTNSNPNFLLLDTNTSKLFWIDTRDSLVFINRISLDGSSRETILRLLNTRIISLAKATLYSQGSIFEYLFYADGGDTINCYVVDLDLTHILRTLSRSHTSMKVFGDELYWFDYDTTRVYSATITPGTPPSLSNITVVFKTDEAIREINLVSTTSVTYPDTPCNSEGLCSYLCLPSAINTKYKCVCPVGIESKPNCSLLPTHFLLISLHRQIQYISLDIVYTLSAMLYQEDRLITGAVDAYTPISGTPVIIWSDITTKNSWAIKQLDTATRMVTVLVDGIFTRGLAVDQMTGNMFYTDRFNSSIKVYNINNGAMKTLIQNDISEKVSKPRSVAIDLIDGFMFWTDWGLDTIERSRLDGTDRRILLSENIHTPSGLSIDRTNKLIYWVDYSYKTIESCDYNGFHRNTIIRNLSQPYSMTLNYPELYFTDWKENTLNYLILSYSDPIYLITHKYRDIIMDVEYIDTSIKPYGPCSIDNGGCTHICLQIGDGKHVCECNHTSPDCELQITTTITMMNVTTHIPTAILYTDTYNIYYVILIALSAVLIFLLVIFCVLLILYSKKRIHKHSFFTSARPASGNTPHTDSPVRPAITDAIFSLSSNSPPPPTEGQVYTEITQEPVSPQTPGYVRLENSDNSTHSTPAVKDIFYTPSKDLLKSISIHTPKRLYGRSKASYQLLPKLEESFELNFLSPSKKTETHYHSSLF